MKEGRSRMTVPSLNYHKENTHSKLSKMSKILHSSDQNAHGQSYIFLKGGYQKSTVFKNYDFNN